MHKDRIPCCVPFCGRTVRRHPGDPPNAEWLCGAHWKMVSHETREAKKAVARLLRKAERREATRGGSPATVIRLRWRLGMKWHRCKCEAIEVAAGITGS